VPAFLTGTWSLKMQNSTGASPYPEDSDFELTFAIDGSICDAGLRIRGGYYPNGNTGSLTWSNSNVGLNFNVSTTPPSPPDPDTPAMLSVALSSAAGTFYGNLVGERSDGSTNDCDVSRRFFGLAEGTYPELFPGGNFVLIHLESITEYYKYYSLTNTFLRIKDGIATAQGGSYGNTPVRLGIVDDLVESGLADIPVPANETSVPFDDYYVSTYEMTMEGAEIFSPIADGTNLTFVITADKKLCVGEDILENPIYLGGSSRVVWNNTDGDFYYRLQLNNDTSSIDDSGQIEEGISMEVFTSKGIRLGTFRGPRT
jgi:hypothetical protein